MMKIMNSVRHPGTIARPGLPALRFYLLVHFPEQVLVLTGVSRYGRE